VVLLSDNARPHRAQHARNLLQKSDWKTLNHLQYSPDFAPRNVHLLPALKQRLLNHGFTGDEDIKAWYYHMADTNGTYVYVQCVQDGQIVTSA
jgi:hypothetical protein